MKLSKTAAILGKKDGQRSAESRFTGKTKEEISKIMKGIRKANKKDQKIWEEISKEALQAVRDINP